MADLPKPPSEAFRYHQGGDNISSNETQQDIGVTSLEPPMTNGESSFQEKIFNDIITSNSYDSNDSFDGGNGNLNGDATGNRNANGIDVGVMNASPCSLPLGVPSDDDDDDYEIADLEDGDGGGDGERVRRKSADQFHSLPSAEELKTSVAASRSRSSSRESIFDNAEGDITGENELSDGIQKTATTLSALPRSISNCWGVCGEKYGLVTIIMVVVALIGFILGLSLGLTENKRSTTTVHGGNQRFDYLVNYLVVHDVSSAEDLLDSAGRSPQYQAVDWLAHDDELQIGIPTDGNDLTSKPGYDLLVRYTMAVFYYATTGKSWSYDLSFLSSKPTCQWYQTFAPPIGQVGVLCNDATQEMLGLSIVGNNAQGSLPSELGKLTTMTYLESISNLITGSLPSELEQLTKLRTLVMTFNMLTGSIPEFIHKWTDLEFVYLSNNMLTGSIPDSINEVSGLSVLALDDNSLSGEIGLVWSSLTKLEYLYLEDNDFSGPGLPNTITQAVPTLVHLDVSNNRLTGPLPADLFRLSQLEVLDLHGNKFSGGIPSDINAGDRLGFLALYENELSGRIPATLSNLQRMSHLDLSTNFLTGPIPLEMQLLTDLTFLFLGANNFTKGVIPTWIYAHENLRELSLKSTRRTGRISELIGRLEKLVLLDLDANELTGQIPESIGLLTNIQYLLLDRNQLSSTVPQELESLRTLRLLLLDRNNLLGSMNSICSIESLKVVYVDCAEVSCSGECCNCCTDGEPCHDYDLIPHADPNWELNYTRQFFNFANDLPAFSATDDDVIMPP